MNSNFKDFSAPVVRLFFFFFFYPFYWPPIGILLSLLFQCWNYKHAQIL